MKVTIYIKDSNYLLARNELVGLEVDVKSKRAVVIGYDIASRIIKGKKVDYGDGDKHGAE